MYYLTRTKQIQMPQSSNNANAKTDNDPSRTLKKNAV